MKFDYQILAYIAICLVAVNLLPQIILIIKNKNANSISYITYIINIISSLLLSIYAYHFGLFPIFIGNLIIFVNSIIILCLKYKYS